MSDEIVAIDIETIPRQWGDETIDNYIEGRAKRKRTGKDIEEKKSLFALDYPFLLQPIAISLVIADLEDLTAKDTIETWNCSNLNEKILLRGLIETLYGISPDMVTTYNYNGHTFDLPDMVVTYNGHTFDLPVLRMACKLQKIAIPNCLMHQKKYSAFPHYDIMQELCGWSYGKGFPLHIALHVWGIEHDDYFYNLSANIPGLIKDGDLKTVSDMCGEHARATMELYKKIEPASNRLPF